MWQPTWNCSNRENESDGANNDRPDSRRGQHSGRGTHGNNRIFARGGRDCQLRRAMPRIERANNTPYGLSAGVWTDKGSKIFGTVNKLRAGVVWVNTYNKFDPTRPLGGYKESGFGREGGRHGLPPYVTLSQADRAASRDL
jgi:aldehyde dehydrogenase family protein